MGILLRTHWLQQVGKLCQRRWLTQSCTGIKVSLCRQQFIKMMQLLNHFFGYFFLSGFGIVQ